MSPPDSKRRKANNTLNANEPINYVNRKQLKQSSTTNAAATLSTSRLKKQLRDTRRLLQKNTALPDAAVKQKQAEIEKLEGEIKKSLQNKQLTKYKQKYKAIKFHDWRKADRRHKHLLKQLRQLVVENERSDVMSETEHALRQQIRAVELDLQYIKHYPVNEKYLSLYANSVGAELVRQSDRTDANLKQIQAIRDRIAKTLQMDSLNVEPIEKQLNIPRTLVSKPHIPNEDFVSEMNDRAGFKRKKSDALFVSDDEAEHTDVADKHIAAQAEEQHPVATTAPADMADDSDTAKPKKSKKDKAAKEKKQKDKKHKKSKSTHGSDDD